MTAATPDFAAATRDWVAAGIIDQAQAQRIVEHEQSRATAALAPVESSDHHPRDRVQALFGVLGGLLIGLGILLVVAANWESIGDVAKLLLVMAAVAAFHALGLVADLRGWRPWVGTVGYVVGTLAFAGGVFLLGQTFNVRAHDPLAFLLVAITATVLAVLVGRWAVGGIAAAAWFAWVAHDAVVASDDLVDERAVLVVGLAVLLVGLAGMAAGWALLGIQPARAHGDAASSDRPLLGGLDAFAGPLRAVATWGLLAPIVPASFLWRWDEPLGSDGDAGPQLLRLTFALVACLVSSAAAWRWADTRHARWLGLGIAVTGTAFYLAGIADSMLLAGIVANLVLALGGLGLAAIGLVDGDRPAYAAGIAWLVALIAARYVDVLTTLELGGLGFIGAGLLLVAIAWGVGRSRRVWRERGAST